MASGMMKAGGAGCILAFIAAIIAIVAGIIAAVVNTVDLITGQTFLWYAILVLTAGIIMNVGLLLLTLGAIGMGKVYKNALTMVSGILGLVGVILGLVAVILAFIPVGGAWIVALAGNVLLGIFFLLFGIGLIIVKDKTGRGGLAMATGIMFIILGSAYLSIIGVLIVPFVLIPALIMGMLVFFRSEGGATGGGGGAVAAAAPEEKEVPKNVCPACGTKMAPSEKFCGNCGKKKEPPKPKPTKNVCTECGTKLAPGAKFCGNCGKTI